MSTHEHYRIENCEFTECPREFVRLTQTDDPKIRQCDHCSQPVYSCSSLSEFKEHTSAGHCVSLLLERRDPSELQTDDLVRITSGRFQNFYGRILNLDASHEHAEIDLEIFGPGPCVVPTTDIGVIREE